VKKEKHIFRPLKKNEVRVIITGSNTKEPFAIAFKKRDRDLFLKNIKYPAGI